MQETIEHLDLAEGEVILDFSGVERIDPCALGAMEKLAGHADERGVKVVLRSVNIAVYKVFKLMRLEPRFTFRT